MKGFEGDVLLLERRAVTDEDKTDAHFMLKAVKGSSDPMWAVLSPVPPEKKG